MTQPDQTGYRPSRLRLLRPEELTPEQQRVYSRIVGGQRGRLANANGQLRGPFNAMVYAPGVGDALQSLGAAVRFATSIPDRARELAILTVALVCKSNYQWTRHEEAGRAAGLTSEEIDAVRAGDVSALTVPEERAAVTITRTILSVGDLSDDEYAEAVKCLGHVALVELLTLIGYYVTIATQLRVFRVDVGTDQQAENC